MVNFARVSLHLGRQPELSLAINASGVHQQQLRKSTTAIADTQLIDTSEPQMKLEYDSYYQNPSLEETTQAQHHMAMEFSESSDSEDDLVSAFK